jgi:type I restriction enzyme S subunit
MSVPKLRFPEFLDAGEWEEKKLGDLSQILRGGSPRPIDEYMTSDVDGLNWLKIGDVNHDSKYVTFTKERVLVTALSKTREVNPGDLIMSNSMSFGRPYILKIKSCIHDDWIAVTKIDEQASRDYLYYLILSPTSQEYFLNNAAGSGVQNLNADIIKFLPALIPNFSEQIKIADCLSSIDELITAQAQKIESLKEHKKGLMQQLFPAEGETVPKSRFLEFRDAGEWEQVKLSDITNFSSGGTPSKDDPEYWGGEVPWISATSMYSTTIEKSGLNITEKAVRDGASIAKKGALLILVRGSMLYNRIPMGIAFIDVAFNQDVKALTLKSNILDYFLLYQLMAAEARLLNAVSATGIGAGKLDTIDLKNFPVLVSSQKEQQKIADCLTSLNDLITAQTQKLAALKNHKKGLMQQLFPAVDEVAG